MENSVQTEQTVAPETAVLSEQPIRNKSRKRTRLICLCAAVVMLAVAFFLTGNPRKYARAEKLYGRKEYAAAAQFFGELENYKDAPQREQEALYRQALEWMGQQQYEQALDLLGELADYKAASYLSQQCQFALGEAAMAEGKYRDAEAYFAKAQPTGTAPQRELEAIYAQGHELFLDGEYEAAQACFARLEEQWPAGGGPHFVTFDEALDYISSQAENLPDIVNVVIKDMPGTYILRPDVLNATVQQRLGYQFSTVFYDETSRLLTVKPSYYPGQKIVFAWKTGDFSKLTEEELEVYGIARDLVSQAQAIDSEPEAVELWLHDWLCENVEYDSPYEYVYPEDFVGLDELTCVGALRDGKANCQGYTDAFYLLGTLAGLEMYIMFGAAGEEGHCWNGIRLDGKIYMVDVTFNDTIFQEEKYWSYIWYNNMLDLDSYTVSGGSNLFLGLVTRKDLSKTYYARAGSVYDDLGDAAYGLLKAYKYNGAGIYHAVVDSPNQTDDDFYKALANNMAAAGVYSIQWIANLYTYEDDTYIFVEWIRT